MTNEETLNNSIENLDDTHKNKLIIENFVNSIVDNLKNIDPDFSNVVDENFWDLI